MVQLGEGDYPGWFPNSHKHNENLLVAKRTRVDRLQHHLAEGNMVAEINLPEASVVQRLLFDQIRRAHLKRRLRRSGHFCDKPQEMTRIRRTTAQNMPPAKSLRFKFIVYYTQKPTS